MTVQIVRLKDGQDIISQVVCSNNEVELTNPMTFKLVNSNLMLQQWLPLAIIKTPCVKIPNVEVLCTMEPNEEFAEYYTNTIEAMNKIINGPEEEDAYDSLMEALDNVDKKGIFIH